MEQHHKKEMILILDSKMNARSFDGRSVFLFGHCNATEEMADYLLSHKITPKAIFDNSSAKQGLSYKGIYIKPPDILQGYTADNSIVLIAGRFFAEMSAQLRRIGYNGEIVQVLEYNSFAEYSLSEETIERKTERMQRGVITLEKIRKSYSTEHLVICPNNALGDVYWTMSFLPVYQKKKN